MRFSIFLIAFLITLTISAQRTHHFLVLDAEASYPVPYANVSIPSKSTGTVGDEHGRFSFSDLEAGVELEISAIGYRSSKVMVNGKEGLDTLYLQPAPIQLVPIEVISPIFSEEVILGAYNENRGGSFGFGNAQLGTELGTVIPIDQETWLKSAHFQLNHAQGDSLLLRLKLYDFSSGAIGPQLLTENVLIREKQRRGQFTVDLSPYDVVVDHPVLLSLEWLRNYDELGNKSITFDVKKVRKGQGTYMRFYSNGPFERTPYKTKYQPCFYLRGKQ